MPVCPRSCVIRLTAGLSDSAVAASGIEADSFTIDSAAVVLGGRFVPVRWPIPTEGRRTDDPLWQWLDQRIDQKVASFH